MTNVKSRLNDEFHGQGVKTYSNGDRYDGGWENGKMNGKGVYTSHEGWRYEGQFKADHRHGTGKTFYTDGDVVSGTYFNDHFRKGGVKWIDPEHPGSYMTVSRTA